MTIFCLMTFEWVSSTRLQRDELHFHKTYAGAEKHAFELGLTIVDGLVTGIHQATIAEVSVED